MTILLVPRRLNRFRQKRSDKANKLQLSELLSPGKTADILKKGSRQPDILSRHLAAKSTIHPTGSKNQTLSNRPGSFTATTNTRNISWVTKEMSTTTLRPPTCPTPSHFSGHTGLNLYPPSDEEREYGRRLTEGHRVFRRHEPKAPATNTTEGPLIAEKDLPEPPALDTSRAAPLKQRDRGLLRRVRSFANLRRGRDGESTGKGKGKQPQSDAQADDKVPPVPDIPTKWKPKAASPDPNEMMSFREILDAGGRIDR
ncbi:hypothetical protein N7G274_002921 [Stereocaulon virgatum]|uniref:Uncharacterized protein n=1 Tax=Stereocaulon virgatum TaxID=373712 RepID=A0ABR4AFC3_9LECA